MKRSQLPFLSLTGTLIRVTLVETYRRCQHKRGTNTFQNFQMIEIVWWHDHHDLFSSNPTTPHPRFACEGTSRPLSSNHSANFLSWLFFLCVLLSETACLVFINSWPPWRCPQNTQFCTFLVQAGNPKAQTLVDSRIDNSSIYFKCWLRFVVYKGRVVQVRPSQSLACHIFWQSLFQQRKKKKMTASIRRKNSQILATAAVCGLLSPYCSISLSKNSE